MLAAWNVHVNTELGNKTRQYVELNKQNKTWNQADKVMHSTKNISVLAILSNGKQMNKKSKIPCVLHVESSNSNN